MYLRLTALVAVTGLSISPVANAVVHSTSSPSWTYFQFGHTLPDIDAFGLEDALTGYSVEASAALGSNFFVRGQHTSLSQPNRSYFAGRVYPSSYSQSPHAGCPRGYRNSEPEHNTLTIGYHATVAQQSSVYGGISLEQLVKGDHAENGFGSFVGLRVFMHEKVEVFGEVGYVNISNHNISDINLTFGANTFLNKYLSVGANIKGYNVESVFNLSVRLSF